MSEETEDQTEVAGGDDAVKKLSAKLDEVLGEKKKQAVRLRELEAAEAERKADLAKREEDEARKKGEWEKIEEGWKAKFSEKDADSAAWKSKYFDREMNLGLTSALDEINVKPELRKAALALLKTTAAIDDDGRITLGDKLLADAITAWSKSEEGKAFIANGSTGGGANGGGNRPGGGDKNPWASDSFNLTEQGRLYRADPGKAREMAAAHGIRLA